MCFSFIELVSDSIKIQLSHHCPYNTPNPAQHDIESRFLYPNFPTCQLLGPHNIDFIWWSNPFIHFLTMPNKKSWHYLSLFSQFLQILMFQKKLRGWGERGVREKHAYLWSVVSSHFVMFFYLEKGGAFFFTKEEEKMSPETSLPLSHL